MQPPRFLALLMDVESCLSGADKGLAVVQEGEPLLSLCKCLHANPVKNCWKIVDHRKQDCKSPQGIHWFIPLLPWGDLSYWREAVLKHPKNLSHALCVFSVYQEGFPDVSHCEGVLLGNVLLCCCTGQENDGESAPKLALLLAQAPAPSAQRPWALGRAGNPTGEPSKQRIFILCNVFCGDTHGLHGWTFPHCSAQRVYLCLFSFYSLIPVRVLVMPREPVLELSPWLRMLVVCILCIPSSNIFG